LEGSAVRGAAGRAVRQAAVHPGTFTRRVVGDRSPAANLAAHAAFCYTNFVAITVCREDGTRIADDASRENEE
jgi:hypothetical protein